MDQFLDFSFDRGALIALAQVILIDITLAGDNAVIIGMVAANVEPQQRRKVVFYGLAFAVVVLISLAMVVSKLLAVIGLTFAGGILLLWVAWRFYRDLSNARKEKEALASATDPERHAKTNHKKYTSLRAAVFRIAVADLSMSLDNVLAVAGAARGHTWVLGVGLLLSIALTGIAAVYIARLLQRFPWISYAGLLMIVFVAGRMIWEGGGQVFNSVHLW
jgi:YjbE family integral membrane protein